jgi:hypothetical protein
VAISPGPSGGVALALALTLRPACEELAARAESAPPLALLGTIPTPTVAALVTGLLGIGIGLRLLSDAGLDMGERFGGAHGSLRRARSDNHGHADSLPMKDARRLFPAPIRAMAASSSARPTASISIAPRASARSIPPTSPPRTRAARRRS